MPIIINGDKHQHHLKIYSFETNFQPPSAKRPVPPTLMHSGPTFVAPGETSVAADLGPASLYGHGFQVSGSKNVTSNVCGPVRLMDKLISARPLRFQYYPEMGDVVLGRVTEILVKRWKIDLNTRHDAALQLSAVHLPDGVQRRRNADDELSMRNRYGDRDIISAEVQGCFSDGSVALHTRGSAYGPKLHGQRIQVLPALVKRGKQHFFDVKGDDYGCMDIEVIFGCNGLVWVGLPTRKASGPSTFHPDTAPESAAHKPCSRVIRTVRKLICRVANAARILAALSLSVDPQYIVDVCQHSISLGLQPKEMLTTGFLKHFVREYGLT